MKVTVTKAIAEFRRTHADTWNIQKDLFSEEQLEVGLASRLMLDIDDQTLSNPLFFCSADSGRYILFIIILCLNK